MRRRLRPVDHAGINQPEHACEHGTSQCRPGHLKDGVADEDRRSCTMSVSGQKADIPLERRTSAPDRLPGWPTISHQDRLPSE